MVTEHLNGDASRLEELWDRVPGIRQKVRTLTRDVGDVHWTSGTADGWYCVSTGSGYEVYNQERGIIYDRHAFASVAAATTSFLRLLGYLR